MELREIFEYWISGPPFEHTCERYGEHEAWPGQYRRFETQLAWEAFVRGWKEGLIAKAVGP